MTTDYNKQATDFLQATGTTLQVVETVPQIPAQWDSSHNDRHISYSVTLKNKNHSYTFNFWGSENDYNTTRLERNSTELRKVLKENGQLFSSCATNEQIKKKLHDIVTPTAYDILACLSPMYEDTFEDFCSAFGYDTDSRTAEDTYKRCIEQDRQLHKLFTHEELEQLAEIN